MVFCNKKIYKSQIDQILVTILILIDGFLQWERRQVFNQFDLVTILILIDGFLQFQKHKLRGL